MQAASDSISHNLNGQKLGRKGRVTRERILTATAELLAGPEATPISLSAVARQASLGMTSLYNYFTDLTELLLAVLEPVMNTAEQTYLGVLREHWADDDIGARCVVFLRAYHDFWKQHSRLLHLRNSLADNRDERMMEHRVRSSQPVIRLIVEQMGGNPRAAHSPATGLATVAMIGLERSVTVATDTGLTGVLGSERPASDHYLVPAARLLELAIRDARRHMS